MDLNQIITMDINVQFVEVLYMKTKKTVKLICPETAKTLSAQAALKPMLKKLLLKNLLLKKAMKTMLKKL